MKTRFFSLLLVLSKPLFSAVLASDDFNRANGSLGANWTTPSGNNAADIVSNEIRFAGDPVAAAYTAVSWPSDQYTQTVLKTMMTSAGDGTGAGVRLATAANTMYMCQANSDVTEKTFMYKAVAGSYTKIGTGNSGATPATGDTIYLEAVGTTLTCKLNGTVRISVTDTSIASGNGGIFGSNSGSINPTGDDWQGGDFSSGATASGRGIKGGKMSMSGGKAFIR